MINTQDRPSSEVLMESLSDVEGAHRVAIIMSRDDSINVRTNCTYQELHWLLAQAGHATLNELFGVSPQRDS